MKNKLMVKSLVSLILSLFMFVVATFSWFAISTNVDSDPINISVDPGIIESFELRYFTANNVYRYDSLSNTVKVYQNGWITPSYTSVEDGSTFAGIIIKEYDPLISENNFENDIYIELYLNYSVEATNSDLSITALSDEALADYAETVFSSQIDPLYLYYFSDVMYLQSITTFSYSYDMGSGSLNRLNELSEVSSPSNNENYDNLYDSLTQTFTTQNPTIYSFNETKDPLTFVDPLVNPITLTAPTGSFLIYFHYYYNETAINSILNLGSGITLDNVPIVRFFQDIIIRVREETGG